MAQGKRVTHFRIAYVIAQDPKQESTTPKKRAAGPNNGQKLEPMVVEAVGEHNPEAQRRKLIRLGGNGF